MDELPAREQIEAWLGVEPGATHRCYASGLPPDASFARGAAGCLLSGGIAIGLLLSFGTGSWDGGAVFLVGMLGVPAVFLWLASRASPVARTRLHASAGGISIEDPRSHGWRQHQWRMVAVRVLGPTAILSVGDQSVQLRLAHAQPILRVVAELKAWRLRRLEDEARERMRVPAAAISRAVIEDQIGDRALSRVERGDN